MNRILDIQKKAEELRQQHRQAIEQQLQSDIQQAVSDTTKCLQQRVRTISNDIDRSHSEILSHQSEATTALLQQIKAQQQLGMTALLQQQQQQIEQLQANLQQLNGLSQEIVEIAKIKKTLISSNIVLISIACIMLISSISLGYISKSKYNELQARSARLQQIEYQTQQKIAEYSKITTDLYKARGGR